MKKVIVTGATGFIGSHLVSKLVKMQGVSLTVLTRRMTKDLATLEKSGVEVVLCELSDVHLMKNRFRGVDCLIHLAGATKTLTEKEMFEVNAGYTENLLKSCELGTHFVLVSSQAVAGPAKSKDKPVTESDLPNPLTWYGKSKLEAENEVKEWGKSSIFTIVRPCSVYGPGERDIFSYFKLVKSGLSLTVGFKEKRLSIIYVDDLVNAILHLAFNVKPSGTTYFASGDEDCSWKEFSATVSEAMGKKGVIPVKLPEFASLPVALVSEFIAKMTEKAALLSFQKIIELRQDYWLCSNALLKSTGWKPEYTLQKGVDESVRWYRLNGWL
ncbi:MAG TPA: NAD-dependent epimerase/dehydratase family protein [bacterium]|nr:NAD-dependent epimerase/dehydratase family protein [bacterium]HRQ70405.1 NAD-dependent epimerase/dehydratase family protein [bacterium]